MVCGVQLPHGATSALVCGIQLPHRAVELWAVNPEWENVPFDVVDLILVQDLILWLDFLQNNKNKLENEF